MAKIIAVCTSEKRGTKKEVVKGKDSFRRILVLLRMPMLIAVPIVR